MMSMLNPQTHAMFFENLGALEQTGMAPRRVRANPHQNLALVPAPAGRPRVPAGYIGSSPEVSVLREYLIRIMPTDPAVVGLDPVPNSFDSALDAAVLAFQRVNGLTPDGQVGPNTWAKLDQLIVGKPSLDSVLATRRSGAGASAAGAPPETKPWVSTLTDVTKNLTGIAQGIFAMNAPPAAAATATVPGATTIGAPLTQQQQQPPPDNTLLYAGLAVGGLVVVGATVYFLTRK